MKLKYTMAVQQVADGFVAVAVGADAGKFGGLVRLNATGAFMMEQLGAGIGEDELVERLLEKYDADEAVLRANVREFAKHLMDEGLLEDA